MTSPLIDTLRERHGWPLLDEATLDAFISAPGERVLFVTGDAAKNLETNDVAVILPELLAAFGGRFTVGVVGQQIERSVRERFDVFPMPSLIVLKDGQFLGAIPKVRDWDDYLTRFNAILSGEDLAA